jgi:hypothetical protein
MASPFFTASLNLLGTDLLGAQPSKQGVHYVCVEQLPPAQLARGCLSLSSSISDLSPVPA